MKKGMPEEEMLKVWISGDAMSATAVAVIDRIQMKEVHTAVFLVQISGSVCENYSVHAGGNVVVEGVVEGAVIDAGGDVVIARGMNGMDYRRHVPNNSHRHCRISVHCLSIQYFR